MNQTMQVTGLGALNMDNIYRVKRVLADGEIAVQSSGAFPGGSAANTIYGLAKLGIAGGFSGAVGDDDCGKRLIDDFKQTGIDTSRISIKSGVQTGSVFCLNTARTRSLYVLSGANSHLAEDDIDMRYVNSAPYLHLASFVDEAQFKLSRKVVRQLNNDVKLSFSPGTLYAERGLKALAPILQKTHVLFINRSEIEKLTGKHFTDGATTCTALGCRTIVVTLGKGIKRQGVRIAAYVREGQKTCWISAGKKLQSGIADTTGAGDAFSTGFLYGLLQEKPVEECGKLGNTAALLKLKYHGARGGLPDKVQLETFYCQVYSEKQ